MREFFRTRWLFLWIFLCIVGVLLYVGRPFFIYPITFFEVVRYYDSPQILFAKGNDYFGGKTYDIEKAEAYYQATTIVAQGFYPGAYYQLGRVYFIKGIFDKALWYINKELAYMPGYKRAYYVRALINAYRGDFLQAEKDFEQFLAWKPASWAGWNDLSWVYFSEGKYQQALTAATNGLHYAPDNPWLNNSAGAAELSLSHYKEANQFFETALQKTNALGEDAWGRAYPGNDPRIYKEGYKAMLVSIEKNIALTEAHLRGQ